MVDFPWRLFESQIYGFINRKNEESMRSMSQWLTDHPEYRSDLIEAPPAAGIAGRGVPKVVASPRFPSSRSVRDRAWPSG